MTRRMKRGAENDAGGQRFFSIIGGISRRCAKLSADENDEYRGRKLGSGENENGVTIAGRTLTGPRFLVKDRMRNGRGANASAVLLM
jgi:hypothetical protein